MGVPPGMDQGSVLPWSKVLGPGYKPYGLPCDALQGKWDGTSNDDPFAWDSREFLSVILF